MSTELIKVEEFAAIMQSAPDSLKKNTSSVTACNNAGQALLDTIEGEGGMNEVLDAEAAEYLKKVKVTITKMEERRKPLTQLFDKVRSVFTANEKAIDPKDKSTIPGKLVYARDQYAAKKREDEKKRQAEAIQKANTEKEKETYKAALEAAIAAHMDLYFNEQSAQLSDMWERLHINSFDLNGKIIREWPLTYPIEHFNQFAKDFPVYYIDAKTKENIKIEAFKGKYDAFAKQYEFDLGDLRQSFVDRLPSKREELTELETLRITNAKAAENAEKERKEREEAERKQRELEASQREEIRKKEAEGASQTAQMGALFATAAASVASAPVNAKITEKIQVLHPSGFVEVYQMWWMNEGKDLTIEELEKIHKKMITFCEKQANKEDVHLSSKYIRYVEDIKAK